MRDEFCRDGDFVGLGVGMEKLSLQDWVAAAFAGCSAVVTCGKIGLVADIAAVRTIGGNSFTETNRATPDAGVMPFPHTFTDAKIAPNRRTGRHGRASRAQWGAIVCQNPMQYRGRGRFFGGPGECRKRPGMPFLSPWFRGGLISGGVGGVVGCGGSDLE